MEREDLIQQISEFIVLTPEIIHMSPVEIYNCWVQKKGIRNVDPNLASWLLDYIKDALIAKEQNSNLLSHFI